MSINKSLATAQLQATPNLLTKPPPVTLFQLFSWLIVQLEWTQLLIFLRRLWLGLTCVGDGEAVGCLDVVHVGHQVKGRLWRIGARVVQKYGQAKGSVLLICVSDEQPTCREREKGRFYSVIVIWLGVFRDSRLGLTTAIQNVSWMEKQSNTGHNLAVAWFQTEL